MSQPDESASLPGPAPTDDEDTAWALSTAHAMWNRGERSEAVKWLRRAAEAASDVEADDRALQLAKAAAELTNQLRESERARSASAAPPPPTVPPPATIPRPSSLLQPAVPDAPPVDMTQGPSEVVSTQRDGSPVLGPPLFLGGAPSSRLSPEPPLTPAMIPAYVPSQRGGAQSVDGLPAAVPTSSVALPSADASAAFSTTYSDGDKLSPVRVSPALHAAIFRDETGALRVAPHGAAVPMGAIAVIVVALDPSADLPSLLA